MSTEDKITVSVMIKVEVTFERVKWHHVTTEDYYVRVTGDTAGIVGLEDAGTAKGRWTFSAEGLDGRARSYPTRDAAAAALVRHYVRAGRAS